MADDEPGEAAQQQSTDAKNIVTDKGTFTLGPVIGKGGFGTVYQGLHFEGGTFVAIKQIKLSAVPKDELGGIMAEIELLRSLDHPNIVRYITYLATAESLSIVMEYVENGSLLRIMKKFGKFPEGLVAIYISQVLEGLVFLHEQGVIHRDIKGANILVTKTGAVKIADFGIASKLTEQANVDVLGTPYWMAPEIIELSGATTKSDIWSVACTVIELLSGQPPYFELAAMPALFRIVQDDHPPIPEGISGPCRDWLLSAFKKEPDQRPSAQKLFNHRWLKDARAKQAASKRTLGLDDAKKMVDDAEALRERRKRNRGNTHDGEPPPQIPLPSATTATATTTTTTTSSSSAQQPSQTSSSSAARAAADLVAQLSAAQPPANVPAEGDSFDLDGIDLGPIDAPLSLPSGSGTRPSHPLAQSHPPQQAVGRSARPEEAENFDDDFGGDLDDLQLPGDGPAPVRPQHQATAPATAPTAAAQGNWTDAFDLPDGSLKLKISPFQDGGVTPQTTPQKPAAQQPRTPPRPLPQPPSRPARGSSVDEDGDNWGGEFDLPDGSLRLKLTPSKPQAQAQPRSPSIAIKPPPHPQPASPSTTPVQQQQPPSSPQAARLRAPLSRHISTQVTKPQTRPHAASIASREEASKASEESRKTATGKIPSPIRTPVSRSQLLATLEAAANSSGPRREGEGEDTWADFDFAAMSGKREDGGEVQLQLRPVSMLVEGSEDGEEPDWGDDDDLSGEFGEEVYEMREEQAALQAEIGSAFTTISRQGAGDAAVISALEKLMVSLKEHAAVKGRAIQQTGTAALADLLESASKKPGVVVVTLRVVNELIKDCPEAQSLFAVTGGFSLVLSFAAPTQREDVRCEVARFATLISPGQLQETFVACRGPQSLVHLLLGSKTKLAKLAVAGIHMALGIQNGRASGDLSRTFVRAGLLPAMLSLARANLADEELCTSIGTAFLSLTGAGGAAGAYSGVGADDAVRSALCVGDVISGILELVAKAPEQLRVALLKTIKLAASDPANIAVLCKAGTMEVLVKELPRESNSAAARYNTLVALSQLCKLNPQRQAAAAKLGIIPHLLSYAGIRSLKDVAIPMLCDLLRVKEVRSEMWKNNCLPFFLDLLRDRIYQPNALESVAFWLLDEPRSVKKIVGHTKQIHKLGRAFEKSDNAVWPRLVAPYMRIANKSRSIARRLAREDVFVQTLLTKLASPQAKADVKKDMLLVLKRLVAVHRDRHAFVTQFGLVARLTALRRESQSTFILVTLIDELLATISK